MYLKMGQKLSQKMHLSPQMLQSLNLLSMPVTEMEQAIQAELEENPVLEEKGDTLTELSSVEKDELEERLNWTQYTSTSALSTSDDVKNSLQSYERHTPTVETLRDHILWQINVSHFDIEEKNILTCIADEINDEGYLKESCQNIAKNNNFKLKQVEDLLKELQQFDPPGVGARNLKECLMIQARHIEEDTTDMMNLIQQHLEDLKTKDYKKIALELNLDIAEVGHLADIVKSMEPIPGRMFSSQSTQYIVPDIYIFKKSDGLYDVSLNEEGIPQIKIASHYTQFLSRMMANPKEAEAQKYLTEKMKRALGFIRALNQRKNMLMKIAESLAREQVEFFEKGEIFLYPFLQREMAEKTGVSISTISRVVTNKFVHTPQGVFELKYFFGIYYLDKDGKRIGTKAVRSMIKNIIDQEEPSKPLSDDKIAELLFQQKGIQLKRRQVTRFREELLFPSAKDRK